MHILMIKNSHSLGQSHRFCSCSSSYACKRMCIKAGFFLFISFQYIISFVITLLDVFLLSFPRWISFRVEFEQMCISVYVQDCFSAYSLHFIELKWICDAKSTFNFSIRKFDQGSQVFHYPC